MEARRGWKYDDPIRWAVYGWTSSAMDDPKEPKRLFSHAGWRGSVKYPFGRAWTEPWGFSDFSNSEKKSKMILLLILLTAAGLMMR